MVIEAPTLTPKDAALEVQRRRKARTNFLEFLKFVWWMPHPLKIGRHTIEIAEALDEAVDKYLAGESSFLDIRVPFRHGKSDLVSRAFPPYFLARCMADKIANGGKGTDPDVIMSGYGQALVASFSKKAQDVIRSSEFLALFPSVKIQHGRANIAEWQIENSAGVVTATGLGGSLSGKGGGLIILDDHTKSRAEARSKTYRDKSWSYFSDSLFTRRAPVSIVIVLATPWDVDDVQGRIKAKQGKGDFPEFRRLTFPARNAPADREAFGEFLFLDRFEASWYREQYAVLGKSARGLLDCDPIVETGNRFRTEGVQIHDNADDFPAVRYVRAWDLASSKKERDSDDPDYTVGMLGAVTHETHNVDGVPIKVPHLWLKGAVFVRAEAPERDKLILKTVHSDGGGVPQLVEAFGAYKDTYTSLKALLRGVATVKASRLPGDKSAKAAPLEPIFEAGNVHLLVGNWNALFLEHFQAFPDGTHDDMVDPAAIIYGAFERDKVSFIF